MQQSPLNSGLRSDTHGQSGRLRACSPASYFPQSPRPESITAMTSGTMAVAEERTFGKCKMLFRGLAKHATNRKRLAITAKGARRTLRRSCFTFR